MEQENDVLVPTTVLMSKKLKDRAKRVGTKFGDFSAMVNEGLELVVTERERRAAPPSDDPQLTEKAS